MNSNLVTVIINTRNGHKYISKTISSVLNQTYDNFELIIFDNMSTVPIANSIQQSDSRIRIIRTEEDLTLGQARNKALTFSQGEFITFLDDDDYFIDNRLERCVDYMLSSHTTGMIYSNLYIYNEKYNTATIRYKSLMPSGDIFQELVDKNFVVWASNFFRKSALLSRDNPFDESFNIIEDYEVYLNLLDKSFDISYIDDCLVVKRYHGDNYSVLYESEIKSELENLKNIYGFTKNQLNMIDNTALSTQAINYWRCGDRVASRKLLKSLFNTNKRNKSLVVYILTFMMSYEKFEYLVNHIAFKRNYENIVTLLSIKEK